MGILQLGEQNSKTSTEERLKSNTTKHWSTLRNKFAKEIIVIELAAYEKNSSERERINLRSTSLALSDSGHAHDAPPPNPSFKRFHSLKHSPNEKFHAVYRWRTPFDIPDVVRFSDIGYLHNLPRFETGLGRLAGGGGCVHLCASYLYRCDPSGEASAVWANMGPVRLSAYLQVLTRPFGRHVAHGRPQIIERFTKLNATPPET
ncbi:hypothetical protein EVAR_43964_1 [Eumeta japonica]|uniref:Uncharacterized protein n=1 Tax=Eumeta variegata TaxID=151549 RepID=A0A4C1XZS7_EUMVA|nr:hypothetical protein EVAR_43964_1 [Eumeta japonica]